MFELIATHRNTPQHTATHCNTLQHTALVALSREVTCNSRHPVGLRHPVDSIPTLFLHHKLNRVIDLERERTHRRLSNELNASSRYHQPNLNHCNTLQHTTQYNTNTADRVTNSMCHLDIINSIQLTATQCNARQRTATHSAATHNTVQHTTHCNTHTEDRVTNLMHHLDITNSI